MTIRNRHVTPMPGNSFRRDPTALASRKDITPFGPRNIRRRSPQSGRAVATDPSSELPSNLAEGALFSSERLFESSDRRFFLSERLLNEAATRRLCVRHAMVKLLATRRSRFSSDPTVKPAIAGHWTTVT
jgi:hypothetical protein